MKLTDLKNVKPKNITLQDANEEYADYLYALPESKSKKQIWTVVGTVAAAVVIVMGVSLWAIIGRGVRGAGEPDGEYFMQAGSDTSSDTTQKPELAHRVIVSVDDKHSDYEEGSYLLTDDDAKALIAALKAKKRTEHTVAADGMIRISTPDEQFSLYIGDDSCHINCKDGGISLDRDDEIITIVKKYIKKKEISNEQPDSSVPKDAVTLEVPQNNIGYKSGRHKITGDDAIKLKTALESNSYTGPWAEYGPAIEIQIFVGEKEYWFQVCVNETRYRISTTDYKTLEIDKNSDIVKIIEKYIVKIKIEADEIVIEKINAKESFANEYKVPADEARSLLTLLKVDRGPELHGDASASGCICMPTHRVYYNNRVYNVSMTSSTTTHFTVDGEKYHLERGEALQLYNDFLRLVSKDYFVVTKKIDTDFKCPGDIKVKAKIKDYLKEIGQLWPSSPEFMEFTISGKDAEAFYKSIRLKSYSYTKYNYSNYKSRDIELTIDGKTYWIGKNFVVTEDGEECTFKDGDDIIGIYEDRYAEALKEQGFDKKTLENRQNLVAYELKPYIESGAGPDGFTFNSIDEMLKAIKTHEIKVSDDEKKSLESYYSSIIDEKDRIDAIAKIGTTEDKRFITFNIDAIDYFYKLKDSQTRNFTLEKVYIGTKNSVAYSYKPNANSKMSADSTISVLYTRPDKYVYKNNSYFDDYVEYYGSSVLSEDGFVYEEYDTFATIMFKVENTVIKITGHGDMANYDALKKLCVAQKVTVK